MAADGGLVRVRISVLGFADLDPRTAYALWRLRQQVFVVEQASPYPDLDDRDLDPTTRHLLAHDGDRLVGCLRILDEDDGARIGRVAVAVPARGRGLGEQLMAAALAEIGDRPIVLDAQSGLARWYESFGFAVCGAEFVEDGVAHLPMRREPAHP